VIRFWYMEQIIRNGRSRDTLLIMIKNRAHERQGIAVKALSAPEVTPYVTPEVKKMLSVLKCEMTGKESVKNSD